MAGRITARRSARTERQIYAKFARTGSAVVEYALAPGATVRDLLDAAGFAANKGDKIRVDGELAAHGTTLKNGNIVTVAGRVEGGSR